MSHNGVLNIIDNIVYKSICNVKVKVLRNIVIHKLCIEITYGIELGVLREV